MSSQIAKSKYSFLTTRVTFHSTFRRAVRKKTVKKTISSPNNSDCESRVSSEDEDALDVILPEPNKADDAELERIVEFTF